jgi:hypothetical protein
MNFKRKGKVTIFFSGIGITFLDIGQVAILNRSGRYIYYLISKENYWNKPDYVSSKIILEYL